MSTATTKHEVKNEAESSLEQRAAPAISAEEAERLASQFTASWDMVPDSPADMPAPAPVTPVSQPSSPVIIEAVDVVEELPMQLQSRKPRRKRPDSDRPPPGPEVDQFVSIVAQPPKRAEVAIPTGPSVVVKPEKRERLDKTVRLDAYKGPVPAKPARLESDDDLVPIKKSNTKVFVFGALGFVVVLGLLAAVRAMSSSSSSSSSATVSATQSTAAVTAPTPTVEPPPTAVAPTAPVQPAATATTAPTAEPAKTAAAVASPAKTAASTPKTTKASGASPTKKSGGTKASGGIVRETPF